MRPALTSSNVQNALHADVLGNICAYGHRLTLFLAWGQLLAVWGSHWASPVRPSTPIFCHCVAWDDASAKTTSIFKLNGKTLEE